MTTNRQPNNFKPLSVLVTVLISGLLSPQLPAAEEADPEESSETVEKQEDKTGPRVYRNPAERREAGHITEITEWLGFSALLEIEKEKTRRHYHQNVSTTEEEPTTSTLQLALKSEYQDWLEIEVVYESEYSRHLHDGSSNYHHAAHSYVDEAEIAIDLDDFGLSFGRLNVPFGEYNSYFVIGPMLEFGETRRDAVMLDYSINDGLEITLFAFESQVDKINKHNDSDWGIALEFKTNDESKQFGVSYTSDLAESDELFLKDYNQEYQRRVRAWSAYLLLGFDDFEISVETVSALDDFVELDAISNKPSSTNFEIVYFASDELLLSLRLAHSAELEDAPEQQYGMSITWLTKNRFVLSADYLYGKFKKDFVLNDDDIPLSHQHQVAARIAIEL